MLEHQRAAMQLRNRERIQTASIFYLIGAAETRRNFEMPRKSNTRAAQGAGSIRQRADGTWEARFVVGHDPGTGKPIRKSVYAKTQKEVRQKLAQAVAAVDNKAYIEPCKMTLGEWLDIWADTYLEGVKPRTVKIYKDDIHGNA